jgi:hypothetical protein
VIKLKKMTKLIMEDACEKAGEFAKQTAINHMKIQFQKSELMEKYVKVANEHHMNLNEEGCLKLQGCNLGDTYKALVVKGINSINLDGTIVEDFQVIHW